MIMQQQHHQGVYCLVGRIPSSYHSADLRKFFCDFIENKRFLCFHFRHRPEHERVDTGQKKAGTVNRQDDGVETGRVSEKNCSGGDNVLEKVCDQSNQGVTNEPGRKLAKSDTLCCVIVVKGGFEDEFIKTYNGKHWTDKSGNPLRQKVKLTLLDTGRTEPGNDSTVNEKPHPQIDVDDLLALPELNPPNLMPQGNVGTPVAVFMELIKTCRLPSHVIRKLKLNFPVKKRKKCYGAVPMDYGTLSNSQGITFSEMKEIRGHAVEKEKSLPYSKRFKTTSEDEENDDVAPSVCYEHYLFLHY